MIQSALQNAKNLEEEQEERERSYNNTVVIIEELKEHKLEEEFSQHVEEVSDKLISVQEKIDKSQNQARVQLEVSLVGLKSELNRPSTAECRVINCHATAVFSYGHNPGDQGRAVYHRV